MPNCYNCNAEVNQNYCPNCGQPATLKRIDGHYITHEIEHILHVERGILYTIKELFLRPGDSIRHFILKNRSRLVKPVIFIIITSLIYSLVNHFFHIEKEYVNFQEAKKSTTGLIFEWVEGHYGYANMIMGVCIALWVKIFFRKYKYNFFETLILLCFVMGMGMLIYTIFAMAEGITHIKLMKIGGFVSVAYCAWGMGQFFDKTKVFSYIKALAAYLLGIGTFTVLAIAIGTFIDLVIKH